MEYKSYRIIDGRPRWVIIDENGKIVNRCPTKEELKELNKFPEKDGRSNSRPNRIPEYSDSELLDCLKRFIKYNGYIPTIYDFDGNDSCPSRGTYQNRFGSWNNALKLAGICVDSIVKEGGLYNNYLKGRLFEVIIRDHFENGSIDLSGNNSISHCDGICPKGKAYDAKSSKLYGKGYYRFFTKSEYKEMIEWYYFGAFNADYTRLRYVWRVPGKMVTEEVFTIGNSLNSKFNLYNMREYEITDRFLKVIDDIKLQEI